MSETVGPGSQASAERAGPGERTSRDDSSRDPGSAPRDDGGPQRGSTAVWVGALLLGGAATALLVLSDDARLLRLGLVAALWVALAGAFAGARLRSQVIRARERAQDDQRIYELELEREIAAREQYEAKAQADAYRQAAEDSGAQLQALQSEMQRLRGTLEKVLGGDVLFEHVALRAESTRVRSVDHAGDQPFGEHELSGAYARAGTGQQAPDQHGVDQWRTPAPATATYRPVHVPERDDAGRGAADQGVVARDAGMRPRGSDRHGDDARATGTPVRGGVAEAARSTSAGAPAAQLSGPARSASQRQSENQQRPPFTLGRSGPVRAEGTIDTAPVEDPGAHTAGTSVEDLLAVYGASENTQRSDSQRRRRRRA